MASPAVSDPESPEIAKKEGVTRDLADQGRFWEITSRSVTPGHVFGRAADGLRTLASFRDNHLDIDENDDYDELTRLDQAQYLRYEASSRRPRGLEVLTRLEGIVLHVKEYEGQPPETMSFSKSASRTISVGRKPSQGYIADDPERALFRCPVVSRKHAKITFTE